MAESELETRLNKKIMSLQQQTNTLVSQLRRTQAQLTHPAAVTTLQKSMVVVNQSVTANSTSIDIINATTINGHDIGDGDFDLAHNELTDLLDDDHTQYVLANGTRDIDYSSGDFQIGNVTGGNYTQFESDGTVEFVGDATVWDDIRINAGGFDKPGVSDPAPVIYYPAGGGLGVSLYEFAKDDWVSFTVQMPHSYAAGENVYIHLHWTPGDYGVTESGNLVGWKIDYSWANMGDTFPAMTTVDLSDACDGTDHKHQVTSDVVLTGTGKEISSMLICNLRRTDTGTDDTWTGLVPGQLPMILEVDIHYPINTVGSRTRTSK